MRKGSTYKKMGADRTITHPFDRSRLPEGAVVISVFKRYAYEQTLSLVEHEYELVKYKLGGKFFTEYLPAQDDSHQVVDRVKGTKASADFHTAISTCRIAGLSVLDDFKTFFRKSVIEGETDHGKLLPHAIGLHTKIIKLRKEP